MKCGHFSEPPVYQQPLPSPPAPPVAGSGDAPSPPSSEQQENGFPTINSGGMQVSAPGSAHIATSHSRVLLDLGFPQHCPFLSLVRPSPSFGCSQASAPGQHLQMANRSPSADSAKTCGCMKASALAVMTGHRKIANTGTEDN